MLLVGYRRTGITYRPHHQVPSSPRIIFKHLSLENGPIGCLATSVRKYQPETRSLKLPAGFPQTALLSADSLYASVPSLNSSYEYEQNFASVKCLLDFDIALSMFASEIPVCGSVTWCILVFPRLS